MNRAIKFRGKRVDNGKWVYGNIQIPSPPFDKYIMWDDLYQCEVNPATVGQYTGLTDKNGMEIYEGDILIDEDFDYPLKMVWFDGCFKLHGKGLHLPDVIPAYERLQRGELRIVGNIHETPELIK